MTRLARLVARLSQFMFLLLISLQLYFKAQEKMRGSPWAMIFQQNNWMLLFDFCGLMKCGMTNIMASLLVFLLIILFPYLSCSHVSYPPSFLLQMPARLSIIFPSIITTHLLQLVHQTYIDHPRKKIKLIFNICFIVVMGRGLVQNLCIRKFQKFP